MLLNLHKIYFWRCKASQTVQDIVFKDSLSVKVFSV